MGFDEHETGRGARFCAGRHAEPALYTLEVTHIVSLPPPILTKDLSAHARRAMRAFERVHKTLEAKKAERTKAKRTRKAA